MAEKNGNFSFSTFFVTDLNFEENMYSLKNPGVKRKLDKKIYKEIKEGNFILLDGSVVNKENLPSILKEKEKVVEETVFNRLIQDNCELAEDTYSRLVNSIVDATIFIMKAFSEGKFDAYKAYDIS